MSFEVQVVYYRYLFNFENYIKNKFIGKLEYRIYEICEIKQR